LIDALALSALRTQWNNTDLPPALTHELMAAIVEQVPSPQCQCV
jgi:hypothetical protein